MQTQYSYRETLAASEKVRWRVEDVIGGDKRLDFNKPFLPESLARTQGLPFLSGREKLLLNQIRGHAYLSIFGLVEEFILPFVLDHARPQLDVDDYKVRALLQFASEEAKHIQLFKRFREEFVSGFGSECAVIGPAAAIAREVLAHQPLAVALVILHIEWMTQRHYQQSVQDDSGLDPQFKSLLRFHWMEEAQHAKLDSLMVTALAEGRPPERIMGAVEEYLEIGAFLDAGLQQQARFDMASLQSASERSLSEAEAEVFLVQQHQANRWTYLGSGMTHPNFRATLESLGPAALAKVDQVAQAFA